MLLISNTYTFFHLICPQKLVKCDVLSYQKLIIYSTYGLLNQDEYIFNNLNSLPLHHLIHAIPP